MGCKFVYVAASFAYEDKAKTEERKKQIEEVVKKIRKIVGRNFAWYLPHQLKIENAWDISLEEWSQQVYEHDVKALENSNIVIFISYGKENNAGSVWEVGWICGYNHLVSERPVNPAELKKKIICIKMTDDVESLMVTQSVDAIIKQNEIEDYDWETLPRCRTQLNKLS